MGSCLWILLLSERSPCPVSLIDVHSIEEDDKLIAIGVLSPELLQLYPSRRCSSSR